MMSYIVQSKTVLNIPCSHLHFLKLAKLSIYGTYMLLMDQVLIFLMSYFENDGERMHYV